MALIQKIHKTLSLVMLIHVSVFFVSGFMMLALMDNDTVDSVRVDVESLRSILSSPELYENDKVPVLISRKSNILSVRANSEKTPVLKGASRHNYKFSESSKNSNQKSQLQDQLLKIHRDFGFSKTGKWYLSYISYLYLILVITGLMSVTRRTVPAIKRSFRVCKTNLFKGYIGHSFFGLLLFPFLVFIGLTGSLLFSKNDMIKEFQKHALATLATSVNTGQKISGADAYAAARKIDAKGYLYYMAYPRSDYGGQNHYAVVFREKIGSANQRMILVNAYTGEATVPAMPLLTELSVKSSAYHRGSFPMFDLKFIWLFFVLSSLFLFYLGLKSMIDRRRLKKTMVHI